DHQPISQALPEELQSLAPLYPRGSDQWPEVDLAISHDPRHAVCGRLGIVVEATRTLGKEFGEERRAAQIYRLRQLGMTGDQPAIGPNDRDGRMRPQFQQTPKLV